MKHGPLYVIHNGYTPKNIQEKLDLLVFRLKSVNIYQ